MYNVEKKRKSREKDTKQKKTALLMKLEAIRNKLKKIGNDGEDMDSEAECVTPSLTQNEKPTPATSKSTQGSFLSRTQIYRKC